MEDEKNNRELKGVEDEEALRKLFNSDEEEEEEENKETEEKEQEEKAPEQKKEKAKKKEGKGDFKKFLTFVLLIKSFLFC